MLYSLVEDGALTALVGHVSLIAHSYAHIVNYARMIQTPQLDGLTVKRVMNWCLLSIRV